MLAHACVGLQMYSRRHVPIHHHRLHGGGHQSGRRNVLGDLGDHLLIYLMPIKIGDLGFLTSLWWTKVFSWSWSTWTGTTSLLNAQSTSLNDLTLETLLGSIRLFASDHLDETEATRFLGVWVKHDLALLNITVLLKETSDLLLGKTWVNARNKKVRTWVDSAVILRWSSAAVSWWATVRG